MPRSSSKPASKALSTRPVPETEHVWRLPSGAGLTEFALHSGFLAPLLINVCSPEAATQAPAGDGFFDLEAAEDQR